MMVLIAEDGINDHVTPKANKTTACKRDVLQAAAQSYLFVCNNNTHDYTTPSGYPSLIWTVSSRDRNVASKHRRSGFDQGSN